MSVRGLRLIYVPGIKPKPPPAAHEAALRRCILEGVRRADAEVAADIARSPESIRLVSWSHLFYDQYRDIGLDETGIRDVLGDPGTARQPARAGAGERLRLLSHRIGDRFPVLIDMLAGVNTRANLAEAERYFRNEGGKSELIRALLAGTLRQAWEADESVLLMAHSLGSVIAWDTLWELSRQGAGGPVDVFLTLGSPLGNRFVRDRFRSAGARGAERYPSGIRCWRNFTTSGDFTALGRRFADVYGEMAELGLVERISDRTDLVNHFIGAEGPNVHRCYGYFVNPAVGAVIADWWRSRGRPPLPA